MIAGNRMWGIVIGGLCAALAWGGALRGVCAQDDLVELEERAVKAAVSAVAPTVVKIETLGGLERVG